MNIFVGLILLLGVLASLARTIARDGSDSRMPPRSHPEEVGSWVEQQLRR
ncbi:hypothetical protein [Aeromicrobium sp.]